MIGITAVMSATPGNGDTLVAEMKKIAAEVVKEEGNHCYLVHQSVDDADTVLDMLARFYEPLIASGLDAAELRKAA